MFGTSPNERGSDDKNAKASRVQSSRWMRKNNEQPLIKGLCLASLPSVPFSSCSLIFHCISIYWCHATYGCVRVRCKKEHDSALREECGGWERMREARKSYEHGGEKRNIVPGMSSRMKADRVDVQNRSTKLADRSPRIESLPLCSFDCWKAHECASLLTFGYDRRIVTSDRGRL